MKPNPLPVIILPYTMPKITPNAEDSINVHRLTLFYRTQSIAELQELIFRSLSLSRTSRRTGTRHGASALQHHDDVLREVGVPGRGQGRHHARHLGASRLGAGCKDRSMMSTPTPTRAGVLRARTPVDLRRRPCFCAGPATRHNNSRGGPHSFTRCQSRSFLPIDRPWLPRTRS